MLNLLENAGFIKESQFKFTFNNDKIGNLEKAVDFIQKWEKNN